MLAKIALLVRIAIYGFWSFISDIPLSLRRFVSAYRDQSSKKRMETINEQFRGNFAPVVPEDRIHEEVTVIRGSLPPKLEGVFLQIGPNEAPIVKPSDNWNAGEAMIHGIRFKNDRLEYTRHQLTSKRYQLKDRFKTWSSLFVKPWDLHSVMDLAQYMLLDLNKRSELLSAVLPTTLAEWTSPNRELLFFNNKLYAFGHQGHPYWIGVDPSGKIKTFGTEEYVSPTFPSSFYTSPKLDGLSNRIYIVETQFLARPYCRVTSFGTGETKTSGRSFFDVQLERPCLMEDFAMTTRYIVILETPVKFRPFSFGKTSFKTRQGDPMKFIVFRKDSQGRDPKVFKTGNSSYVSTVVNSWEEESNRIVVIGMRAQNYDRMNQDFWNPSKLYKWTLDLQNNLLQEEILCQEAFYGKPLINPRFQGRRSKYVWMPLASTDPYHRRVVGIGMIDIDSKTITRRIDFESNSYASAISFLPMIGDPALVSEEDGHLYMFLHRDDRNESQFVAFDSHSMAKEAIFTAVVPERVPFGLSAIFLTDYDLDRQGILSSHHVKVSNLFIAHIRTIEEGRVRSSQTSATAERASTSERFPEKTRVERSSSSRGSAFKRSVR